MHDLLAAKEIFDNIIQASRKNNLKKVTKVVIELGQKKYAHGGHEHIETINPENLEFNLKLLAKNTIAENAKFIIKKPARFALRSRAGGSDKPDILVKEIEGE